MKTLFRALIFLFFIIILFSVKTFADVPKTIAFQGRLTDNTGFPVTASNKTFTFDFYDALTGGNLVFSIIVSNVNINDGIYGVILGFSDSQIEEFNRPLFVQVAYNDGAANNVIGTRTALGSSPYALSIRDHSISTVKIATGAVTTEKINDGSITPLKMNSSSGTFDISVTSALYASVAQIADSVSSSFTVSSASYAVGAGTAAYATGAGYAINAGTAAYALTAGTAAYSEDFNKNVLVASAA
ncbi:MAG: hypothetical protein LBD46_01240, partial [Endomicrobium sp.]|nr:hypothetical protein [Endomicrobium sp.]